MKNKLLLGIITFFLTIIGIITFLNLFDSETIKNFSFDRRFNSKNCPFIFQNKFKKMSKNDCIISVNSDCYIVERDMQSVNNYSDSYVFYYSDFNFKTKKKDSVKLPKMANILFSNLEKVIYTNQQKIYEYDKIKKCNVQIKINKSLKLTSLKPLKNSKTKYLCFAEILVLNKYKTGFFIIDFKTKEIKISKLLEENKSSSFLNNSLRYSGRYSYFKKKKCISYCCDKFSKIYFFDENGFLLRELTTFDKTPLPIVVKNKSGDTFYKRGATWSTNMGLFLKNDRVFVFSACYSNISNYIIIDEYSFTDSNYIKSYKMKNNNKNSFDINNIYSDENKIVIEFESYYASFIFT